jgi:hypothetical protein
MRKAPADHPERLQFPPVEAPVAEEPILLIADLIGTLTGECGGGWPVHGEVWLRRYEGLVAVYWEVRQVPVDEDAEPAGDPRHTNLVWGVARTEGPTRWQSLLVLASDQLPAEVGPLPAAFADPARHDTLLHAALSRVGGELWYSLSRSRFLLRAHCWRPGYGAHIR